MEDLPEKRWSRVRLAMESAREPGNILHRYLRIYAHVGVAGTASTSSPDISSDSRRSFTPLCSLVNHYRLVNIVGPLYS